MTTCAHHLNAGALACTQDAGHTHGCTFIASDAPDLHTASEQRAEETR